MSNNPYRHLVKPLCTHAELKGSEMITSNLINFFMDLSEPQNNYYPQDDISKPINRLWKLLYYDTSFPLAEDLPTDKQKLTVRYNGRVTGSQEDSEKDYRLFPIRLTQYAQLPAQTVMRIYCGEKHNDIKNFNSKIAVYIQLLTSTTLEWIPDQNMSRLDSMEQCIVEALNGLPTEGGGIAWKNTVEIGDLVRNLGRKLIFVMEWKHGLSIDRWAEYGNG